MSLPNHLAKIKSAGIYRFVWDKSVVPPQQAETLRLLVGYSEKGPFNTPVYIESVSEFKAIYGGASKRLERKGVYFHRMAEQALQSGPILALNIKPFTSDAESKENPEKTPEMVEYTNFNFCDAELLNKADHISQVTVMDLYDRNRFWKLDADKIVENLGDKASNYVTISTTDTKDTSCSIFIRKYKPASYKDITFRRWYNMQGIEYPEYMEDILDTNMDEYFAEIYVFRGEFTESLCKESGPLGKYFDIDENGITLKSEYKNSLGKSLDVLEALSSDSSSNFLGSYEGCTLPYFKDANGNYISLDINFNSDHSKHKMMMKLDESKLENPDDSLTDMLIIPGPKSDNTEAPVTRKLNAGELVNPDVDFGDEVVDPILPSLPNDTPTTPTISGLQPLYMCGYTYGTINKTDIVWSKCKTVLEYQGIYDALTNRVDVEYHYIVDTFDTQCGEGENKAELFNLAKNKDNAFAIINFPKMSSIIKNLGTIGEDGSIDMQKTMEKYTLPSEVEGASYGAYYTQLTFSDGTLKTVIPSAALVSNLFMNKWGPRQPYYIVAGPNYGVLSYSGLVGPDYNFGRSDLDILEPKGINAIIYVPRLGTYISSNQTAKQIPVSGLSKIHIRELVIYLQNEIEHLLQSYQWELNTQPLRDTIKAKADAICDKIMNNGGIYAYVNICNETNNTAEVIDNEMIILDTEIEPARGAGKMVHQLTIHKTGGLSSSIK